QQQHQPCSLNHDRPALLGHVLAMNAHENALELRRFIFRELNLPPFDTWVAQPLHLGQFRSRLKMQDPSAKRLLGRVLKAMPFTRHEKEKGMRSGGDFALAMPNRGRSVRDES